MNNGIGLVATEEDLNNLGHLLNVVVQELNEKHLEKLTQSNVCHHQSIHLWYLIKNSILKLEKYQRI